MIVVERKVYYCEFCKRHRMTAAAIEKHEPRCIYNPDRSACGWHEPHITIHPPQLFVAKFKETLDLDWLREQVHGCPACILAVVVQADLTIGEREECGFVYDDEVERFRKAEARGEW